MPATPPPAGPEDFSATGVPPASRSRLRGSAILWKVGLLGFLGLLLLIPLGMIANLLRERQRLRDDAVEEIARGWGGSQTLVGPILRVPYRHTARVWQVDTVNGQSVRREVEQVVTRWVCLLPSRLEMDGQVQPERRWRGIFQAVVYQSRLTLRGEWREPDWPVWKIDPAAVSWKEAEVLVFLSDLRGIGIDPRLELAGQVCPLRPGGRLGDFSAGLVARTEALGLTGVPGTFALNLDLRGSDRLSFAPLGETNRAELASPWADPSFTGAWLPSTRQVEATGFQAAWDIAYFGRSYPQVWLEEETAAHFPRAAVEASACGVRFLDPVDHYRTVERTGKYGILVITLIFAAFFLFELLAALRVHPFQYLLVGAALVLFFLAVLALSEFLAFGWAYLIGAGASTALVSLYSLSLLGGLRRGALVGLLLGSTYAVLFVLLQLQDYALLLGTATLFLVLATIMYLTRRIDWYGLGGGGDSGSDPA